MYRNVKDKVLIEQKMVGFIIGSGGKTKKNCSNNQEHKSKC